MNNGKKLIISSSIILTIISCIVFYNIKNPIVKGLSGYKEIIEYDGELGVMCTFFNDFTEAEYLGRTEDKDFKVYAYKYNSKYNLFTLVGSDNTDSYITGKFVIPTFGEVTNVFLGPAVRSGENKVVKNESDIEMFKKLISYENEEEVYHINNTFTEGIEIYFAYDNCPVVTYSNLVGYIAYVNDNWIIVKPKQYIEGSVDLHEANLLGSKITDPKLVKWLNEKIQR